MTTVQDMNAAQDRADAVDLLRAPALAFIGEVYGYAVISDVVRDADNIEEGQASFANLCKEEEPEVVYEALRLLIAKVLDPLAYGES